MKELLNWRPENSEEDSEHPVTDLHSLLKAYAADEHSLEGLLESMDSLILMLKTAEDGQKKEITPPQVRKAARQCHKLRSLR